MRKEYVSELDQDDINLAAELRKHNEKFFESLRQEVNSSEHEILESSEALALPTQVAITSEGRKIVGLDPNIAEHTMKELLRTEAKLLSDELLEQLTTWTPEEIIKNAFFERKETGLAHLSQCIKENLLQTKADLICRYSNDRRIPFVVGAYYLYLYTKHYPLF